MRIGILSSGGDCPGINATIRGVGKSALHYYGMELIGIHNGFSGLLNKEFEVFTEEKLSGILNLGGTILGTSREKPFKKMLDSDDNCKPQIIYQNYLDFNLDCIVCIGGNGTQKTAWKLSKLGMNVIGIPKTIDNDVFGTDISFGFDSAVNIATEAIDRLHSTASSHKRVMVVEVMGHKAGWIALYAGMAGGADVILIPELGCNMDRICDKIMERSSKGKAYSIVVFAEGIKMINGNGNGNGNGNPLNTIASVIEKNTSIEARTTVLGYIQRGGNPSPFDRNLATRLGSHATELIAQRAFNRMVNVQGNQISSIDLSEIAGKIKLVPVNHDLIMQGRKMGISFGI